MRVVEPGMGGVLSDRVERRARLTPEQKWEIFVEASRKNVSDADVCRRWGIQPHQLRVIRERARDGSLKALGGTGGGANAETMPWTGGPTGPRSRLLRHLRGLRIDRRSSRLVRTRSPTRNGPRFWPRPTTTIWRICITASSRTIYRGKTGSTARSPRRFASCAQRERFRSTFAGPGPSRSYQERVEPSFRTSWLTTPDGGARPTGFGFPP